MTSKTDRSTKPLSPLRAGIARAFISFRQIDRLFQLSWSDLNRQYLADVDGSPAVISVVDQAYGRGEEAFDPQGRRVGGSTHLFGAVYRAMRSERPRLAKFGAMLWTFAREMSRPVEKKRIYVFRAEDERKTGLRLFRELDFGAEGRFRICDKDGRPVGPEVAWLDVESLSFVNPRQSAHDCYFAMLAPFPLPVPLVRLLRGEGRAGDVDRAVQSVSPRVMPVWDPFFTDSAGADAPTDFSPLNARASGAATQLYRMHLVDPVDEAILRAMEFQDLHRRWTHENKRLAKDVKYRVACQIRNIIAGDKDKEELVGYWNGGKDSLGSYFAQTEELSRRLGVQMEFAGDALLTWLGSPQAPVTVAFDAPRGNSVTAGSLIGDTFWIRSCSFRELAYEPAGKLQALRQGGAAEPFNLFVGLFDDFRGNSTRLEELELIGVSCLQDTLVVPGAANVLQNLLPLLAGEPTKSNEALAAERLQALTSRLGLGKKAWDLWLRLGVPLVRSKGPKELGADLFGGMIWAAIRRSAWDAY